MEVRFDDVQNCVTANMIEQILPTSPVILESAYARGRDNWLRARSVTCVAAPPTSICPEPRLSSHIVLLPFLSAESGLGVFPALIVPPSFHIQAVAYGVDAVMR